MGGHEAGTILADCFLSLVLGALLFDKIRQRIEIEGLTLMRELNRVFLQYDPDDRTFGQIACVLDELPTAGRLCPR